MKRRELVEKIKNKKCEFRIDLQDFLDFHDDEEIVLSVVKRKGNYLKWASDKLKNHKEIVLEAVKNGSRVSFASKALKNDREFISQVLQIRPDLYNEISDELKHDRDLFLTVMCKIPIMFNYVGNQLKNDRILALELLKIGYAETIQIVSDRLKNDKELVIMSVKIDPLMVKSIPKKFLDDEDVIREVVNSRGILLEYASQNLRNNVDIVMTALKNDKNALYYGNISETLLQEKSFNRMLLELSFNLKDFKCELDHDFILEAIKKNPFDVKDLPIEYQTDRVIAMEAVERNGIALKFLSEEFCEDQEIVMKAVSNQGNALMYASFNLKRDKQIILCAVKSHASSLNAVPKKLKEDREFILEILKQNGESYKYIQPQMKTDQELQWLSKKYFKLIKNVPMYNIFFKFSKD
jgi:hypothetical protein